MRMRTKVLGASLSLITALTIAGSARAQDPPRQLAPRELVSADRFFTEPAVLGDAWRKAVNAALASWTRLMMPPSVELAGATEIGQVSQVEPVGPARPRAPWLAVTRVSSAVRRGADRDRSPAVQPSPVVLAPPMAVGDYGRLPQGVVPGAWFRLPWRVP